MAQKKGVKQFSGKESGARLSGFEGGKAAGFGGKASCALGSRGIRRSILGHCPCRFVAQVGAACVNRLRTTGGGHHWSEPAGHSDGAPAVWEGLPTHSPGAPVGLGVGSPFRASGTPQGWFSCVCQCISLQHLHVQFKPLLIRLANP